MRVREVYFDAATGAQGERWVEVPGVVTPEVAATADAQAAQAEQAERTQWGSLRDQVVALAQGPALTAAQKDIAVLARAVIWLAERGEP